ncbi:unnamed protein product [Effrenium voratum]|uniref:Uncharacterized protein n=1 Tax=Effrenium voratum TaxID=2562239 RepID=A0AA36J6Z7_9DINO|nr:unnamed protein product [Effrenium voratum]
MARNLAAAPSPAALAADLQRAEQELAEVKAALRERRPYLGLTGGLLRQYAVEAAKKENLLRLALSRRTEPDEVQPGAAFRYASQPPPERPVLPAYPARKRASTHDVITETPELSKGRESPERLADSATQTLAPGIAPVIPETPQSLRTASKSSAVNDLTDLALVLELMQSKTEDDRLQRACLMAVARLAKDAHALRPLCLGVVCAVAQSAALRRQNLTLQRLAVAALSSVAYVQDVAMLVLPFALPVVVEAALAFPEDSKLQTLACEAFARLAQGGSDRVVAAMVKYLEQPDVEVSVLCDALQRLFENDICHPHQLLDELIKLSDGEPTNLELQMRVSVAVNRLPGAIYGPAARGRGSALRKEWTDLLVRFLGAEEEEAKLDGNFHSKVQRLFHKEVALHFEYEASERCLHYLQKRSRQPAMVFQEVMRSLAENLEDYRSRLEVRELAWDAQRQALAPLDPLLRLRLQNEVLTEMELRLPQALRTAASAAADWPAGEAALHSRTESLLQDCRKLLESKTEVTQAHNEKADELRRESIVFEAVRYLEMQGAVPTQVRTALHMLKVVELFAPARASADFGN